MDDNEDEFGILYKKRVNLFTEFVKDRPKSEHAQEVINKIKSGILKRNIEGLPEIEKKERKNKIHSNAYATGGLVLASMFAAMCIFGDRINEKVFSALSGAFVLGEGLLIGSGFKYHLKLLSSPSFNKTKSEIEKIESEFKQFGGSEDYVKAFMYVNNLNEQKLEDENNVTILTSPLSRWSKLVEIYPEIEQ